MFTCEDEKADPKIIKQGAAAKLEVEPQACPYWFPHCLLLSFLPVLLVPMFIVV